MEAVSRPDVRDRLDAVRLAERCVQDQIAELVSRHLFGKAYDALPFEVRSQVEGAALRALRSPFRVWRTLAADRAREALEVTMTRGWAQGHVRAVIAQQIGVFETSDPFQGPGDAVRVYDAAEAEARGVR